MNLLCVLISSSLVLSFMPAISNTASAQTFESSQSEIESVGVDTSKVVVKFKESVDSSTTADILEKCEAVKEKSDITTEKITEDVASVEVQDDKTIREALSELNNDPRVEYAEPNYVYQLADVDLSTQLLSINDPDIDEQWYLNDPEFKIGEAWSEEKCNGSVTVAVVDSGVDANHPDLANNIVPGCSFADKDKSDYDDKLGHGTRVAGIIAAQSNNNIGISGVSYNAKILPIKVTNEASVDVGRVVSGIEWAISNKSKYNIKVINLSLGSDNASQILQDAVNHAWESGILCVCASGNSGRSDGCLFPASMDTALAVGSIGSNHVKSLFSTGGNNLDVVAPGEQIYSTTIDGKYESGNGSSGTSFSTPFVSGVAALCFAANVSAGPEDVKNYITSSAKDLGTKGKDIYYGSGMVVVSDAIKRASEDSVHRLYNPNTGEHFYTASTKEKDSLVTLGWTYENIGWWSPKNSSKPVYRLYNPNSGDHHYTTDKNEYNKLASLGWKQEGISWYSAEDSDKNKISILRQYNKNAVAGAHNFTQNSLERANLVSVGWIDEGIAWWGIS